MDIPSGIDDRLDGLILGGVIVFTDRVFGSGDFSSNVFFAIFFVVFFWLSLFVLKSYSYAIDMDDKMKEDRNMEIESAIIEIRDRMRENG